MANEKWSQKPIINIDNTTMFCAIDGVNPNYENNLIPVSQLWESPLLSGRVNKLISFGPTNLPIQAGNLNDLTYNTTQSLIYKKTGSGWIVKGSPIKGELYVNILDYKLWCGTGSNLIEAITLTNNLTMGSTGTALDASQGTVLRMMIEEPKSGLQGSNYILLKGDSYDSNVNAAELQDAYTNARDYSSDATNRFTIIVPPSNYTFGTNKFTVDGQWIDIVSLTGNADVMIDGINITGNDVFIKGLNCGTFQITITGNLPLLKIENCISNNQLYNRNIVSNFETVVTTFSTHSESLMSPGNGVIKTLYRYINTSSSIITVGSLGGNIDGVAPPYSIPAYKTVTFITDGYNWFIV